MMPEVMCVVGGSGKTTEHAITEQRNGTVPLPNEFDASLWLSNIFK